MKRAALLTAISGALFAPFLVASIENLDLRTMLQRVDSAIVGTVTSKTTWSAPLPDGEGTLEFTTITVEGEDVLSGRTVSKNVNFVGTDQSPTTVMPSEAETRVGTRIVAFSKKSAAFGVPEERDWMYASHGGVFRIEAGPKGDVVLGKGGGFAIRDTLFVSEFRTRVAQEKPR